MRDFELGVGRFELKLWWERYGEGETMPQGRASRWWYWVAILAAILASAWLVAAGRL